MPTKTGATSKWYQQFWPWFLIALPSAVVVASIITIIIAITHGDNLVRDDYYKDGLAINRYLKQDETARQMQLSAAGKLSQDYIEITLRGVSLPPYPHLVLHWQHPTNETLDIKSVLLRDGDNHYRGQLSHNPEGRWYITLTPFDTSDDINWRLKTEFNTDLSQQFIIDSQHPYSETP